MLRLCPRKMLTKIIILISCLPLFTTEYIPKGPTYPCPKEKDIHLLYPCICERGTDSGLFVSCENNGLAAISVGLGNIAGLGLPIEKLVIRDFNVAHLHGSLFHRSKIRLLHITDTTLKSIDEFAFAGVNRTLQELHIKNSKIDEFPKDAFKILGNISILSIDGHEIKQINKDIFYGSEMSGKIEKLHISNGLIEDVAPDAFQNLKRLKTLDLHGNKLVNLKRNQFKGLREVEVLDLSHNNLTKLDGSHIGDLTKLGWCNISHNNIADMPRGMFARNTVLKVLHFDNNKLKKLDTNSFRGMRFLRRLYLQDNAISDIGRGTFSAVTRIGTVDLARNKLKKVDFQMFQAVKYAEIINLAENQITTIETQAFTDLYLATVNISHNALSGIEPGAFVNCNNMTVLDLSYNNLTNIDVKAFDENTYAFELKVTYNYFTSLGEIPIGNMSGLRILNASYNSIHTIPKNSIPKLYELHTIDVSHNDLKEIYNSIFQNLFSLRFLNLSYNSLTQIKPATFGTLPTVLELDLSHNNLKDVSRGSLAKLASCRLIDMSFNQLDKVFQIPISLGELILSNNRLSSIKPNTWPSMNALLRLDLSNNNLSDTLDGSTFDSLLTLQRLNLSNNSISLVPWEPLSKMSSLQYLYLKGNNISTLQRSAFGTLPTMFEVDLSNNGLSSIEVDAFKGLQQLIKLDLSDNVLEEVPNEAFRGLVALRHLDLSNNLLFKLDNKTNGLLDDCLSLEVLNLRNNTFTTLTKKSFPYNKYYPYKLYEVDLSYNQIPVLTIDIVEGLRKMIKLNVSYNSLNDIRNDVLGNLTSLQVLDISNNELSNFLSIYSDKKFNLPQNITHIYANNNQLSILPTKQLIASRQLKRLDVRDNQLTYFEPGLVDRINSDGLVVYFEGNQLNCDCYIRPLRHYLDRRTLKSIEKQNVYTNIKCAEPSTLRDENILSIDEDRFVCYESIDSFNGSSKFDLIREPDVAIRDVQFSKAQIEIKWYVLSTGDVADFYIFIRNYKNKVFYTNTVSYTLRSLNIIIDENLKNVLKSKGLEICVQSKSSAGSNQKLQSSQCTVMTDFDTWPQKLSQSRTKKRKYTWFGNGVLNLVNDSILITLCIFLGACFRRFGEVLN